MKKGTVIALSICGGAAALLLIAGVVFAALIFPVLGNVRRQAKQAITAVMLSNLQVALAEYQRDNGVYPPDRGAGEMDKCSETLYFYLTGSDVDSTNNSLRSELRSSRRNAKAYFDCKQEYLADYDGDGYYEMLDAWGGPWIYVAPGPGRQQPDRRTSYDLYSVGPDGKTGDSWNAAGNAFELPPDDPASFYRQAADDPKDGDAASGARYSADDIANF
ncbi:MAG TPA: hypothetical protein VM223_17125 [Planctomycetota bacterium]|nr:hypothetical protein [Planctomycetota bacterium]